MNIKWKIVTLKNLSLSINTSHPFVVRHIRCETKIIFRFYYEKKARFLATARVIWRLCTCRFVEVVFISKHFKSVQFTRMNKVSLLLIFRIN